MTFVQWNPLRRRPSRIAQMLRVLHRLSNEALYAPLLNSGPRFCDQLAMSEDEALLLPTCSLQRESPAWGRPGPTDRRRGVGVREMERVELAVPQ